jgi:hypothetical protein
MESDTVAQAETGAETEVMAAIEEGPVETFIVADVGRDEAYVTVPLSEAASLPAWR